VSQRDRDRWGLLPIWLIVALVAAGVVFALIYFYPGG
jgi:hypothetical protein